MTRSKTFLAAAMPVWVGVLSCLGIAGLGPSLRAQGRVNFNNRVAGVVVAPVFWMESDYVTVKTGNPAEGYPVCDQVYGGAKLQGTGFTAELWGGPEGTPANLLMPLAQTVFRTGTLAGFVQPVTSVTVPSVPPGQRATLQLRVWDNKGGTITNWLAVTLDRTLVRGFSAPFVSDPLPAFTPVNLDGLRSFCMGNSLSVWCRLAAKRGGACHYDRVPLSPVTLFEDEDLTLWIECEPVYTSIQWSQEGTVLPGATNDFLYLPHARQDQSGTYSAVVTLPYGQTSHMVVSLRIVPPPRFAEPRLDSGGSFTAMLEGATNRTIVLELSGDLRSWMPWNTQSFSGTAPFTYPAPLPAGSRFIRARVLP